MVMTMVILVFMSSWGTNTKVVLATDAMTASSTPSTSSS